MTHIEAMVTERDPHRFTLLLLARTRAHEDAIVVAVHVMASIARQHHRETFLRQVTHVIFSRAR